MRKSFLKLLLIAGLAICPSTVKAVTFTTDKLIDANDYSYDGNDIVVDDCTLTVNGKHQFNSLQVINGGVVTHSAAMTGQPDYRIALTIAQEEPAPANTKV